MQSSASSGAGAQSTPPPQVIAPVLPPPPDVPAAPRSWRKVFLRIALILWIVALLVYYGAVVVRLVVLVVQGGVGALNGSAIAQAFFFDQLLALPAQQPVLSALLLIGVPILTLFGDWALLMTLKDQAKARGPRGSGTPPPPFGQSDPPVATIGINEFLVVMQQLIRGELIAFRNEEKWLFRINLTLSILGVVLAIVGVVPTIALISGATGGAR